ncbi:MAG: hypothetical protein ACX939_00400 [Hyphococcus sp.]
MREQPNTVLGAPRDAVALNKLLKVAKENTKCWRADLADISRARLATESALHSLESDCGAGDPLVSAAFSDAEGERRRSLQAALMTLSLAEDEARAKLQSASREIGKLEQLLAANGSFGAAGSAQGEALTAADVFRAG